MACGSFTVELHRQPAHRAGEHKRRAPRAVVPMIVVESFKTPRRLTSYGYAMRVSERHKACLAQL